MLRAKNHAWHGVRCPDCNSCAVVRLESKEGECTHQCDSKICEVTACSQSVNYVTTKTVAQRFKCLNCGYRFSIVKRIK